MKKVTYETRLRNKRIVHKRERRREKIKRRLVRSEYKQRSTLVAPEAFGAFDKADRNQLLLFLSDLRIMAKNKEKIVIDFTHTTRMNVEGVILLKAELDRLFKYYGDELHIRCIAPKSPKIKQVLQKVGIFESLKFISNVIPKHKDVVHWNCAHGTHAEGEKYESILGDYEGTIAPNVHNELYKGITEAMANSVHHAYIDTRKDGLNIKDVTNDWWMFSQEKEGKLTVVFCDIGIGIPASIPKTRPLLWNAMKRFRFNKDSDIIKFAAGGGRSRTEKKYRGKGLPQILSTFHKIDGSTLLIMSNRGSIFLSDGYQQTREFKRSIHGTLIMWQVPLDGKRIDLQ